MINCIKLIWFSQPASAVLSVKRLHSFFMGTLAVLFYVQVCRGAAFPSEINHGPLDSSPRSWVGRRKDVSLVIDKTDLAVLMWLHIHLQA
jgi:hypothetical protein